MPQPLEFTPIIMVHIAAAVGALVTGGLVLSMRKGTTLHRILGRTWVVLMLAAALVSFGIRSNGHYSWIHLLSVLVVVSVSASLFAAAKGRIAAHRKGMTYAYVGLVVAAVFTLLPARRLGYIAWHAVGLV